MATRGPIICDSCQNHLMGKRDQQICTAFPTGIPTEILTGELDHSSPFDGDGGILYSMRPGLERFREAYYRSRQSE